MWKHKNFINLQLCAGEVDYNKHIFVNSSTEDTTITAYSASRTWEEVATSNADKYTINGNNVVWNDGTILQYNGVDVLPTDTIVENGQYTTRTATPTLTFKHLYDAGTIGTGTYKFRHYSQQEPSSGETWVLNETLTLQNIPLYIIPFTSAGQSYKGMEVSIDSGGTGHVLYSKDGLQYGDADTVYSKDGPMDGWEDSKWRTIVYPTPVTDVTLLPWLQANGVKQ